MPPLIGEMAALTTALCWSFTAMFFSYGGRRFGSDVVNRSRLLFALGLYMAAHTLLYGKLVPTGAEPWRWGWLSLSGILGLVIGDAALFQAFVLVGPRVAMLMMTLVPIISTGLAWLFLSETVSQGELAGIALTVGAVAWVVTEPRDADALGSTSSFRTGILLGMVGAAGQATNLVTAKYGLVDGFPAITASYMRIIVAAAVLWGLSVARGDVGRIVGAWSDRRAVAAVFGGSVVGPFLGVSLSLLAVQTARIGIASTLMTLPPILLIPLERVVHGRRTTRRGVVGTGLAVVGVAVLFLSRPG